MKIFKFIIITLVLFVFNAYGTEISENKITSIEVTGIQRIERETVISYSNININDI